MRKRSSYRPKPEHLNSWERVIQGVKPLTQAFSGALVTLKLKNLYAVESLMKGEATYQDVNYLVQAFNIAEAYATHGKGKDWESEINAAQDALVALGERQVKHGKFILTGPEMQSMKTALEVHDAQLDASTVREMEEMIAYVVKIRRSGKERKIPSKVQT